MPEILQGLFTTDFLPHGWCYRWDSGLIWLHTVSDLLIAIAYYFIPFALIYIVRRRGDLAYPWMFWLFGIFILACGTTHLMSVLVVWQPWYRLDGFVKLITAVASVPTAVLLLRVAPAVIALPSPEQLSMVNRQLAEEIAERKTAEQTVRSLNAELEERVRQRTAELEQLNEKLRESEYRLRAILDSSPALVFLKGTEGDYQFVNRQFAATFGLDREQIKGKSDLDLFPETAAEAYRAADDEVLRTGAAREFEELAFHGGEAHTYMSLKFPLIDQSGRTYAICGIANDITERKRAEQALRRYTAELEQFAYVAAHDLQEPLRNVKSYSQLLVRRFDGQLGKEAEDYISFITSSVDRMHDLISGLQAYSELNRMDEVVEAVDSGQVLDRTASTLKLKEAGAEILRGDLPMVRVGETPLGRVFQNLISNSLKYRSTSPPRIEVSATQRGHEYEFIFKDNGIGLDMKYADRIFGVFRRLHGREIPGTGIGLAICKKVIESVGGRIWVISQPGHGAEFHFTLPGFLQHHHNM